MDKKKGTSDTPTSDDLIGSVTDGYMKYFPSCLAGGSYTIGNMVTRPTCSISGHVLN